MVNTDGRCVRGGKKGSNGSVRNEVRVGVGSWLFRGPAYVSSQRNWKMSKSTFPIMQQGHNEGELDEIHLQDTFQSMELAGAIGVVSEDLQ